LFRRSIRPLKKLQSSPGQTSILEVFQMAMVFYTRKNIEKEFYFWFKANRLGGAFPVWVGHIYDDIVQRNTAFFKEHPEYFAQKVSKGELPASPKFDVSKKELVQFIKDDA
jgi:hypothetical protein